MKTEDIVEGVVGFAVLIVLFLGIPFLLWLWGAA